jgi:uncharacterized protein YndB with AHSA1/START domain
MAIQGKASVVVEVSPQEVYEYLLDFTRHPEWSGNLRKVTQLTEGPVRAGTRFRTEEMPPPVSLVRRVRAMTFFMMGLARRAKPYSEAEVISVEPPQRIAWHAWIPQGEGEFNRAVWEVTLEPAGDGTRVTQGFRYQPDNAIASGMLHALGNAPGIEKACTVNLRKLKARLEAARHRAPL